MSGKFTHYLVTRYNVKINGYGPEFISPEINTPTWESERTNFFEIFCAPTVVGQFNQNFTWLIYCDTFTPSEIRERIRIATQKVSSIQVIDVRSFDEMLDHLRHLTGNCNLPFVITTRLDNDDGLGINFINDIQLNFIPQDLVILNQLGGVNYHIKEKILTLHRYYLNNSFTSLIEKTKPNEMITIMGFNHLHPLDNMKTINIKKKHAFMRTLHHQNTVIRGNRGWPILPFSLDGLYSFNFSEIQISIPNMIMYTIKWLARGIPRKLVYIIKEKWPQKNN